MKDSVTGDRSYGEGLVSEAILRGGLFGSPFSNLLNSLEEVRNLSYQITKQQHYVNYIL